MPFPQLQKYKREYPELAAYLTGLELFLDEVLRRPPTDPRLFFRAATHDIKPKWVGYKLEISPDKAIALLYLCDQAQILEPRFDVYCPDTSEFIARYSSAAELPQVIECENHEREVQHSIADYLVELVFEFRREIVNRMHLVAAG